MQNFPNKGALWSLLVDKQSYVYRITYQNSLFVSIASRAFTLQSRFFFFLNLQCRTVSLSSGSESKQTLSTCLWCPWLRHTCCNLCHYGCCRFCSGKPIFAKKKKNATGELVWKSHHRHQFKKSGLLWNTEVLSGGDQLNQHCVNFFCKGLKVMDVYLY